MTPYRKNKLLTVVDDITDKNKEIKISLLHGSFGIGKSEFIEEMVNELAIREFPDAFCSFNYHFDKTFLVDFLAAFDFTIPGSDTTNITYNFDECIYNRIHLRELLDTVEISDKELYREILNRLSPKYFHTDNSEELDDKTIEERLANILDKKGERRFLLRHNRVIAESLLVDLMNFFYPLNDKFKLYSSYLSEIKSPVRIIIVQDNIDSLTYSILKWLNDDLLPLLINGKFGELISYNIDEELKDIEISKFFDFRFIISSRNDISKYSNFDFFTDNKVITQSCELSLMARNETKDYLLEHNINESFLDLFYSYSSGLPFVIDLLADFEEDEINEVIRDSIYDIFTDKLLDGRSEHIVEAIKMSALNNDFDEDYLRCNRKIEDNHNKIYNYLQFTNDLYSLENGRLSLKEPIKKFLAMSLERNSKSNVIEYRNIAAVYNKTKLRYSKLSSEELNILRSLAYFNNFDTNYAINPAFDDKSEAAKSFIKSHKDLFIHNKHTLKLKDEERDILNAYNRIIDRQKYELKKQFIANIWKEREKELKDKLSKLNNSLNEIEEKAKVYGDDPAKVKMQYDTHQKEFIEKENGLINLRKKLDTYSYNKYVFSLVVNITAAVMSFIIGYFFPELFSTPENHSSVFIIQYILFFISFVFLLIGVNFIYKIIKAILNKKAVRKIQEEISQLEDERLLHKKEMKSLKTILADWQRNVNEINEQKRTLSQKINKIKELRAETYIFL